MSPKSWRLSKIKTYYLIDWSNYVFFSLQVGLSAEKAKARDLFEQKELGTFMGSFHAIVNPSGVVMVRLSPLEWRSWMSNETW